MSCTEEKPLILTVDDEPEINTLLKEMLELKGGFRTICAESGKKALDILELRKEDLPALVLLDIMMEPMDGWETLKSLKDNAEFKSIPVIMLTAKPLTTTTVSSGERVDLIENYIVKPITYSEITTKIDEVLGSESDIRDKVKEFRDKGKEKEAKEYERCSRSILRHKKLIVTLKKCAATSGTEDSEKVIRVVNMQKNIIKMCELKLKRIEDTVK